MEASLLAVDQLPANLSHSVFKHLVEYSFWSLKTNGDVLSNGHVETALAPEEPYRYYPCVQVRP